MTTIFRQWDKEISALGSASSVIQSSRSAHSIHGLVSSEFLTRQKDFSEKEITYSIGDCRQKGIVDEDSFRIALMNLVDNACKYAKPGTRISIQFSTIGTWLHVSVEMTSLYVSPDEYYLIGQAGHRGREALKIVEQGQGIGMGRVVKFFDDAGCEFQSIWGPISSQSGGLRWASNSFVVKIPLQDS